MELGNVAYICDRKQCENCSFPICYRTLDINHAANFSYGSGYFYENRKTGTYVKDEENDKDPMTLNEYQDNALRTANRELSCDEMLLDGLMGLCGESGEAIDILKKARFQGHELDQDHLKKELGDVAWYLAVACFGLGYSLEEVCMENIRKLKERYPEGFSADLSVNRKEGDV